MKNPREAHLDARKLAREGKVIYGGSKFLVSFDRATQERVETLAGKWRVPRAEIVRYLVAAALDKVEKIQVPKEDQEQEEAK